MLVDFSRRSLVKINHYYTIERVSESSVIIRAKDSGLANSNTDLSSLQISNVLVNKCLSNIQAQLPNWLIDYVIAYDSLLLEFDFMKIDYGEMVNYLRKTIGIHEEMRTETCSPSPSKLHKVGVCYDFCTASHPNDMDLVRKHSGLLASEIIQLHQSIAYQVFAIGFMPHFAYLGELPPALAVPRLDEPRLRVPAGAVAIADRQTAVYPNDSPGGWHIIGYTHFRFTDDPDSVIQPNDKVSFVAVDLETFEKNTTQ
jgi:KipI family sensor histidine kinase inhibitor